MRDDRCIALNFHGLGTPHEGIDAAERPYWLGFDAFEDIVDRIAARPDRARYLFTFDDGNASDLAAAELLARAGFTGRFYILTGRFGRSHYLTREDVRRLHREGMAVGLHGRDHLDWRKLDDAGLARETVDARRELEGVLGVPVGEVAIPFGAYDRRVFGRLKRQGFVRVLTSDGGTFRPGDRIWNRTSIRQGLLGAPLAAVIDDGRRPFADAARAARLLVKRHLR